VITRLADVLVIQAIRAWLETDDAARTGWLGALADRHVGRALALIHRDPARDWTVVQLAGTLGYRSEAVSAGRSSGWSGRRRRSGSVPPWGWEESLPAG
jgi:hypothetical protein